MKTCLRCKEDKPLSEFHKNKLKKDGYHYYCKTCNSELARQYLKDNPEKAKRYRRVKKLSEYGLTVESYDAMLAEQGGMCPICHRTDVNFHIDHCHETGRVRGILCQQCNNGLGLFFDNVESMQRAIEYLGRL